MRWLRVRKWKWCELIVKVKCGTNHGNNQHHLQTCRPKPCAKIFERDDRKWKLNASQWVFWWWCGKDGADDNTERFFGSILCELVRKKSGHMPTSLLNAWQCQCKEIYVKCQYFTESRDECWMKWKFSDRPCLDRKEKLEERRLFWFGARRCLKPN